MPYSAANWRPSRQQMPISPKLSTTRQNKSQPERGEAAETGTVGTNAGQAKGRIVHKREGRGQPEIHRQSAPTLSRPFSTPLPSSKVIDSIDLRRVFHRKRPTVNIFISLIKRICKQTPMASPRGR